MGKDIHLLVEIKEDNIWLPVDEIPESLEGRNYTLFSMLEDIGNRGIPDELKGKKFRYDKEYDYWQFDLTSEDLFGHAVANLEELKSYLKKKTSFSISREFLDKFFELGGILPDGMTLDPDENEIYFEITDEDDQYAIDALKEGIKELEDIMVKHKGNDVRLVFAFDW